MNMSKPPGKIKALILSMMGVQLGEGILPAPEAGAVPLTHARMLGLSAAWGCTRLIAETLASLPLSVFEKTSAGKRVATDHPMHFILHDQPNADTTAAVFWEAMVAAMLLRGNAYAEKLMLGDRIVGLAFIHPDRLSVRRSQNGAKSYQIRDDAGRYRDLPARNLWHIPGFSLDGKCGVSVIQYGANVFGTALATQAAARGIYERGLHQTAALKLPNTLRDDQREDARATLQKLSGAVNSGKSIVLEAGSDIVQVGIKPADAQMVEALGFSVEDVCRWFRVPPFMVGHTEKSTSWGSGIEQQMIGFLTFTLGPWIRRIEQSIAKDLLPRGGRFYPHFAVEGLLRADSAARAAFYSVMVNNGILTRDEVRELEDRPAHGGNAAVLTVQTALAPLDSIGQSADSEAARSALKAWLREPAPQD